MNNLALYRKYRPRTFAEIIGQEHIVQTLTNAIAFGMTSHAYLFTGPRGTGKTTIARLLAKALNCKNRKENKAEPCDKCDSCLEINQGNAIDLIEIDAGTNTGIDDIRELKDGIAFQPAKSKFKVFIIDECHQLSLSAVNALLKTLEEPPRHTIFILATTESQKMIPTIISRCQRFDFRRLKKEEIVNRLEIILKKEKIGFEKNALDLIAISADGSARDSESLLGQAISFSGQGQVLKKELIQKILGIADQRVIFELFNFLKQKNTKSAIKFINNLIFEGVDIHEFTKSIIQLLRNALLTKIDPEFNEPEKDFIDFVDKFSETEIKEILEKFIIAEQGIKYASIQQLPVELAIIEICLKKE